MTNNVAIFFTSSAEPEKFADSGLNFFHAPADLQNEGKNDWSAPMIAHWPGKVPSGEVSDFNWSAQDFLPTAAQIGYARRPKTSTAAQFCRCCSAGRCEASPDAVGCGLLNDLAPAAER